jgi:hypothetical protein
MSALRTSVLLVACAIVPMLRAQQADTAKKGPLSVLTDTAQRYGLVPSHFTIGVGGFLPTVSSAVRLSSPSLPGSDVDLENKLGLTPHTQNFEALATVKLSKRQLLTLGYFAFNRSATKTITEDIDFGDTTYTAGATVDANSKLAYYGVTYRYYFLKEERWELGGGLGIDALNMSAGLKISGTVGASSGSVKHDGSLTAPAPMVGLYADWEFQPRFYLRAQLQYLYINNIESYGGHISDDQIAVEWFPLHNYGIGAAYHYINLKMTKTFTDGGELEIDYTIQGPALYLTAAF